MRPATATVTRFASSSSPVRLVPLRAHRGQRDRRCVPAETGWDTPPAPASQSLSVFPGADSKRFCSNSDSNTHASFVANCNRRSNRQYSGCMLGVFWRHRARARSLVYNHDGALPPPHSRSRSSAGKACPGLFGAWVQAEKMIQIALRAALRGLHRLAGRALARSLPAPDRGSRWPASSLADRLRAGRRRSAWRWFTRPIQDPKCRTTNTGERRQRQTWQTRTHDGRTAVAWPTSPTKALRPCCKRAIRITLILGLLGRRWCCGRPPAGATPPCWPRARRFRPPASTSGGGWSASSAAKMDKKQVPRGAAVCGGLLSAPARDLSRRPFMLA